MSFKVITAGALAFSISATSAAAQSTTQHTTMGQAILQGLQAGLKAYQDSVAQQQNAQGTPAPVMSPGGLMTNDGSYVTQPSNPYQQLTQELQSITERSRQAQSTRLSATPGADESRTPADTYGWPNSRISRTDRKEIETAVLTDIHLCEEQARGDPTGSCQRRGDKILAAQLAGNDQYWQLRAARDMPQTASRPTVPAVSNSSGGREPVDQYGRPCGTLTMLPATHGGSNTFYHAAASNRCTATIDFRWGWQDSLDKGAMTSLQSIRGGATFTTNCETMFKCTGQINSRFDPHN